MDEDDEDEAPAAVKADEPQEDSAPPAAAGAEDSEPDAQDNSNNNNNNNNTNGEAAGDSAATAAAGTAKGGPVSVRPVFLGNLTMGFKSDQIVEIFSRPILPPDVAEGGPIAVDRMDLKRGYCFVFLKDVASVAEKEQVEKFVTGLNGMAVPNVSSALRVEFARGDGKVKRKEDERRRDIQPSETLFVVNFHEATTKKADLEMLFGPYGQLVRIDMKGNYCFVQFGSIEEAKKAKEATNGGKLDRSVLTVEYVANRRGDGGGRRGGGGYRGRSGDNDRRRYDDRRGPDRRGPPPRRHHDDRRGDDRRDRYNDSRGQDDRYDDNRYRDRSPPGGGGGGGYRRRSRSRSRSPPRYRSRSPPRGGGGGGRYDDRDRDRGRYDDTRDGGGGRRGPSPGAYREREPAGDRDFSRGGDRDRGYRGGGGGGGEDRP